MEQKNKDKYKTEKKKELKSSTTTKEKKSSKYLPLYERQSLEINNKRYSFEGIWSCQSNILQLKCGQFLLEESFCTL